jgi:hypothetical protein
LLGIVFVYAASRDVVPPVSYITPLDAWLIICGVTGGFHDQEDDVRN